MSLSRLKLNFTYARSPPTLPSTSYYAVGALDQDTAAHIIDYLSHLPPDSKYEGIKNLLIDTFSAP